MFLLSKMFMKNTEFKVIDFCVINCLDCRGDRAPVVPAYGAQDHGYPDCRAALPRYHDYYHEDEYITGVQGDPHRRGDYYPQPDYPRDDRDAPLCAPPRSNYAVLYDREYDCRRYPSPFCRHHDNQCDGPNCRREDHRARMHMSVRVVVPVFDGSRKPKDFIDWESSMNSYFRWYHMDTDLCVKYAEMRLGGQAKIFWENEYLAAERRGLLITTWAKMVQKLLNKYVLRQYEATLFLS